MVPEQGRPPDAGGTGERNDLRARLHASEQRMRLLVEQVADYAILALDPDGTIRTWNLGAERVKGWTAEEAIGRSFEIFYPPEDRESGLPALLLAQAREQGRVEHRGWRLRKDGSRFWGEVLITALHDEQGRLTGYAKVTRDRSEMKAVEDAQDAFYAGFRHDFRTPVTAINGFAEALRDADEETREFLVDRIQANTQRLMGMVDGLVHFAQERRSHADIALTRVDAAAVARAVVGDLAPGQRPQRVHVDPGPAWVLGDRQALHRVLANLVVNAVRYSEPGAEVQVRFPRARPGGPCSSSRTTVAASTPTTCPRSSRASSAAASPARTAAPGWASPACATWCVSRAASSASRASSGPAPGSRSSCPPRSRCRRRTGVRPRGPRSPQRARRAGSPPPRTPSACAGACEPGC